MTRALPEPATTQAGVLAFLADPASYPARPSRVDRIETHGAVVFLAGDEVFKIKRAVQFSYMDFSTLARRRAACAREIEVNQPQAPTIYRGLCAITREADGRLAFDGPGEPVEWAVRMARFNEADVLANRAAKGPFSADLGKTLADAVFRYHAAALPAPGTQAARNLGAIVDDVAAALGEALPPGERATVTALRDRLRDEAVRLAPLLTRRAADGHVRRCHGDLHLGNIVLIDGAPVLFDALEFDEDMATIDTLYDLAFLLMDLDHGGQREAANTVLNRYLWRSRDVSDLEGLAALPLFMALRAAIRAMVRAQRARQAEPEPGGRPDAGVRAYLARASDLLAPSEPVLVLVGGLSGSGKSTLAARLAPRCGRAPGALHLRTDLERKSLFGAEELQRLPPAAYTREVTQRVYAAMLTKAETALRAGHSVIADAVHADLEERRQSAALAAATGARLVTLWLEAPPGVLLARVVSRVRDASDATPEIVTHQIGYDLGPLDWTRIDASRSPDDTFRNALTHIYASNPSP